SPLGPQLAHADLEALGDAAHAGDHLVVVDAAYEAFGPAWRPTGAMGDAFVWIRSLSKSFGLPGLRFGYLEARPALVAGLT
ncbi:aminotransferase class I/II-fold pyridoxal phosphate-dependent enzyme, partial [Clostridioides difficile]|nr:aminotransferase class I/II-fold pyridoxal phosphate-dependent enzyme [Clostridioides difficile]